MRKLKLLLVGLSFVSFLQAQETFPVNGTADERTGNYAFTNATIVKDAQTTLQNATLVIKQGKIVGVNVAIPKDAVVIDCKGKFIYPSFIDLFSDYGVAPATTGQTTAVRGFGGGGGRQEAQTTSNTKGAYGWNQAIKAEVDASKEFTLNDAKAKELRTAGFGTVLSNLQDGIARGTATLVTLGSENENFQILKERASANYSFSKGSSTQDYPGSLMGTIALIRQTYLDAQWYKSKPATEGINLSLQAWNDNQSLPQIFDLGNDKWNALRADKIAKEFGVHYILKGGGEEYQRLDDIKATKASFILPLNFPQPPDVSDPNDVRSVSLSEMKNWEMAPSQPAMFEKAGIEFAITATGATDFLANLRKAIQNGLSETKALEGLTKIPATLIGVYDKVGSIDAGKVANFIITNGPIFKDSTIFFQNWVQGKKYSLKEDGWNDYRGDYTFTVNTKGTVKNYDVVLRGAPERITATLQAPGDSAKTNLTFTIAEKLVKIGWSSRADQGRQNNLSGVIGKDAWTGNGYMGNGDVITWKMVYKGEVPAEIRDTAAFAGGGNRGGGFPGGGARRTTASTQADVIYPFEGYGNKELPKQEDILIKNATVWTNEKEGNLENTDVLLKAGKIAKIGKGLSADGARVIDGTGKFLSAGVIDEHSHIAATGGINECTQAVTAEVRIADVINPDDIAIYRHLASGVTSEHILHGSCNPIGGQTQLIKLRWGKNAEDMKFANWDPFIKFALGENVKKSSSTANTRFPDTRMGVEQVYADAFQRAVDYQKMGPNKRKDLELEAISEILNKKRFITSHSYVQSEINMLMKVTARFGIQVNTFTHILEGYKVADKMKANGVAASTFSDWWAYKAEVQDAIAYNAAIMQKMGIVVAINSDDAEQATHLNQEAAKTIKYGDVPEKEAFKMATLNPATMLHVADRVGSIKVGKDADVVLWSDQPLSVYAKSLYTIVDGVVYFDREKDAAMEKQIAAERSRLIQKLLGERRTPGGAAPARGGRPRTDSDDDGDGID